MRLRLIIIFFVLSIVVAVATGAVTAQTVSRGPYLQQGDHDGIVVRWRTDIPTDSRLHYGVEPDCLANFVDDAILVADHEIELSGLSPATRYCYAVGTSSELLAGNDGTHFFKTAPLPGDSGPTRIWVLGDSGTADANAAAVRNAYFAHTGAAYTHLWLLLGDNAYSNGTDLEYQSALFDVYPSMLRQSVAWPTLGNHDTPDGAVWPYFDIFTLPSAGEVGGLASGTEFYYSFDYANIHFVVLDSYISNRLAGSAMLTWLELDLAGTSQEWIVAYWHHPPYSKGSHDSDNPSGADLQLVQMRENAVPVLEDYGVDLVLSGHSHSYERSYLIDGHYGDTTSFVEPMKLDGGDGNPAGDGAYSKVPRGIGPYPGAGDGAVYTVAGSSGKISGGTLDHPAMQANHNVLGSVILEVNGNRMDATFLDHTGLTRDSFTLIKSCPDADTDSDNLCDFRDPCPTDPDNDLDQDGLCGDVDNCPADANPGQLDGDGDGVGDLCDSCPADSDNDVDTDGLCSDDDNCPLVANPTQSDTDGDGIGDACEDPNDDDGDGVNDGPDNCPTTANPTQANSDNDFHGDACDNCPFNNNMNQADDDSDGVGNKCDNCKDDFNPGQEDGDGDGDGDACDPTTDSDSDGLFDEADNCPTVSNVDQANGDGDHHGDVCDNCPMDGNNNQSDSDGDGVGNTCDNCSGVFNPVQGDLDGDGIGDLCDEITDSDADGVIDVLDCAPSNASLSRIPESIGSTLTLDKLGDDVTFHWKRPSQGATANVYRGELPGTVPSTPVCLITGEPGIEATATDPVVAGAVAFYLVTARNACGEGGAGSDSGGVPRSGWVACPSSSSDFDADGVPDDSDNCPLAPNPGQSDGDLDFSGDDCDACPTDPVKSEAGICGCWIPESETDGDGLLDCVDNCPASFNPDQADGDGDDIGDLCENPFDQDGDGVLNGNDNCPSVSNLGQENRDEDNFGDACDNCPAVHNNGQQDSDGDGIGDFCDPAP